jgi:hypothetical protein
MDSTEYKPQEEGQAPPPKDAGGDFKDFLGALVLIAVSAAFAVAALRIPFQTSNWVWYTSPGIFALAMAIFLGGCSLFVAWREIRRWLRNRQNAESILWGERLRLWGMKRFLAAVAIIIVYIFLLGKLPFLIASVGLILTLGTGFREGRFRDALRPSIIASLVVIAIALAISKVFGILFP